MADELGKADISDDEGPIVNKEGTGLEEEVMSISSDEIGERDVDLEPCDVSSDEDEDANNMDNEVIQLDDEQPWTSDKFVPDPSLFSDIRIPWGPFYGEGERQLPKMGLLVKSAISDLSPTSEFTVDDWDATMEELFFRQIQTNVNVYLKSCTEEELVQFGETLSFWVIFGLTPPENEKERKVTTVRDKKQLLFSVRHLSLGIRVLSFLITSPHLVCRRAAIEEDVVLKLVSILIHNRITKLRVLCAETLFEMLCADDDEHTVLKTVRSSMVPVPEKDENGETPSPRFTVLQTLINMFTDIDEGFESKKFHQTLDLLIRVVSMRTLLEEVDRQNQRFSFLFGDLPYDSDALKDLVDNAEKLPHLLTELRERFFKALKVARDIKFRENRLYRILDSKVFWLGLRMSARAETFDRRKELFLESTILPWLEDLLSDQGLSNGFGLFLFSDNVRAVYTLLFKDLPHALDWIDKLHASKKDVLPLEFSTSYTLRERVMKAREQICFRLRALQLMNELRAQIHISPQRKLDSNNKDDEEVLLPMISMLKLANSGAVGAESVARVSSMFISTILDMCLIFKETQIPAKMTELKRSTLSVIGFEMIRIIFKHYPNIASWQMTGSRVVNLQSKYSCFEPHIYAWAGLAADSILRAAILGVFSAYKKIQKIMETWLQSSADKCTPEMVQTLRLLQMATEGNRFTDDESTIELCSVRYVQILFCDAEKFFKRITTHQFSLWQAGESISTEDAYNYREAALSCCRIFTIIYKQVIGGTKSVLNVRRSLVESLLEVVAMSTSMNGQVLTDECRDMRMEAIRVFHCLFSSLGPTSPEVLTQKDRLLRLLLDVERPSLSAAVFIVLNSLLENDSETDITRLTSWGRIAEHLLIPSPFVQKFGVLIVRRLFHTNCHVADAVAKSILDYLGPFVVNRSLESKKKEAREGTTTVTDISDDEDAEKHKLDLSMLFVESDVKEVTALLTMIVEVLDKTLNSLVSLSAIAAAVESSHARARTWRRLCDLAVKVMEDNEEHKRFSAVFGKLASNVSRFAACKELPDDLIEARKKAEAEREEKRRRKSEPVGADTIDLELEEVDEVLEEEPELVIPETSVTPRSAAHLYVASLCKWSDLPLSLIKDRLKRLTTLSVGLSLVKEVARHLSTSLPVLLSRLDSEFSTETACIDTIEYLCKLLDKLQQVAPKVIAHLLSECEKEMSLVHELLSGSGGAESSHLAARFQGITQFAVISLPDTSYVEEKLSMGSVAVIDKLIKWEEKDRPILFRDDFSLTCCDLKMNKTDQELYKECVTITKDGESLKRVLRSLDDDTYAVRRIQDPERPQLFGRKRKFR